MLPDYLAPGLRVVFRGTAAGLVSASRGRYYAGSGNEFWGTLYETGFIPVPLGPSLDRRVLDFGIGLTDLAKAVAAASDRGLATKYDVPAFVAKMEHFAPTWVAFHGKEASKAVSRFLGHGTDVALGKQAWRVADSMVFVLPSMSGANRDAGRLEGKSSREEWFRDLSRRLPARGRNRSLEASVQAIRVRAPVAEVAGAE